VWDHEILYVDSSAEAGKLLMRPIYRETKNRNMAVES
jgi:hypothetical protein